MENASPTPFGALKSSPVFLTAPTAALMGLARLARRERMPTRTLLCAAGEPCDALRFVCSGAIDVSLASRDGRVSSLSPVMPGGWATWLGCFHDAPLPHDLWAAAGTAAFAFPKRSVLALANDHPAIYRAAIQEIGARMRALMTWTLSANTMDGERALAQFILASCRAGGCVGDGPTSLDMTQEQIGHLGFGSRQRVGRLLSALERRSLIVARYGRIHAPSLRKIERFLGRSGPQPA
jgi:CRP-like cAMP-binding protein